MSELENKESLQDQVQQRRDKLRAWRDEGQAYPSGYQPTHTASEIFSGYGESSKEALAEEKKEVVVAGRMMMRRLMGKASFTTIQDGSGRLQLYVRKQDVSEDVYEAFKHWDLGDIVYAKGYLFRTNTGELSLWCQEIVLLTKALRPLPDKYHGLQDVEMRYRQRYLDLMTNQESVEVMKIRCEVVRLVRQFFHDRGFLEVETPMMQVIPGGAAARPFVTHLNALDMPLYLRIAPELYLKRLVVGGVDRVFELNRNFRNEGMSTRHNPEFTMVEFYQAYATYHDMMDLTESLFAVLLDQVCGSRVLDYEGEQIDFSGSFTRLSLADALMKEHDILTADTIRDRAVLTKLAKELGIEVVESFGEGKIQLEIFEKTIEKKLIQPTFITDYPIEVSPLARCKDDDVFLTDRFEFFVAGRELANGFSELNDPEDQVSRFQKQVALRDEGDQEAMLYDEDFVTALEYGMPPTAGQGIGIDRLVMLLANRSTIRDVILFPMMRPQIDG